MAVFFFLARVVHSSITAGKNKKKLYMCVLVTRWEVKTLMKNRDWKNKSANMCTSGTNWQIDKLSTVSTCACVRSFHSATWLFRQSEKISQQTHVHVCQTTNATRNRFHFFRVGNFYSWALAEVERNDNSSLPRFQQNKLNNKKKKNWPLVQHAA